MRIIKKKNIIILLLLVINCSLVVYSYSLKNEMKNNQNIITGHELNERVEKRDVLQGIIKTIIDTNKNEIISLNKIDKFILNLYNKKDFNDYSASNFISNDFYLFRKEYDKKFRNLVYELTNKENLTKDKLENLYNDLDQVFNTYDNETIWDYHYNNHFRMITTNFTKQNKDDILSELDYCLEELIK